MKISDLKKRKEELGYTNEKVSALSGVPLGTVQKIFGGATSKPRYNTLQSIECALFPELHSNKEASLYKDMVHKLSLDYADRVSETPALDEYISAVSAEDIAAGYEKVISWKAPGEFTKEDLNDLPDGLTMELINGVLCDRNTPTTRHQVIALELFAQLNMAIRNNPEKHRDCLVLAAPTTVQPDKDDDKNVFIPDVLAVCDKDKYKGGEEIIGAPDFVAEVLSPSTKDYDKTKKLIKYWDAGVREYWIIAPESRRVFVYILNECTILNRYSFDDQIPLSISGGEIVIDFKYINDRLKNYFGE